VANGDDTTIDHAIREGIGRVLVNVKHFPDELNSFGNILHISYNRHGFGDRFLRFLRKNSGELI
jgi:hypothetical protein